MQFGPPCMVLSTIGLTSPGKIERGARAASCKNHLHQLHVCLPSSEGAARRGRPAAAAPPAAHLPAARVGAPAQLHAFAHSHILLHLWYTCVSWLWLNTVPRSRISCGTGRTRLLYRMSLDFMHWTRAVPGIDHFWRSIAAQVRLPGLPRPLAPGPLPALVREVHRGAAGREGGSVK